MLIDAFILIRCCDDHSFGSDDIIGYQRSGLRHFSISRAAVFPNFAHGARGSPRWHLETPWLRCLRTQTGSTS